MGNGSRIRDSIDIMWQELLKPEWCPHLDSWFCTRFSCLGCAHPTPPPPPQSFNYNYIVSRWRWALAWGAWRLYPSMCTVVLFNAVIVTRWTHDSMNMRACVNDLGYRSLVCSWSAYLPCSSATPFPNHTSQSCIFLEKSTTGFPPSSIACSNAIFWLKDPKIRTSPQIR